MVFRWLQGKAGDALRAIIADDAARPAEHGPDVPGQNSDQMF